MKPDRRRQSRENDAAVRARRHAKTFDGLIWDGRQRIFVVRGKPRFTRLAEAFDKILQRELWPASPLDLGFHATEVTEATIGRLSTAHRALRRWETASAKTNSHSRGNQRKQSEEARTAQERFRDQLDRLFALVRRQHSEPEADGCPCIMEQSLRAETKLWLERLETTHHVPKSWNMLLLVVAWMGGTTGWQRYHNLIGFFLDTHETRGKYRLAQRLLSEVKRYQDRLKDVDRVCEQDIRSLDHSRSDSRDRAANIEATRDAYRRRWNTSFHQFLMDHHANTIEELRLSLPRRPRDIQTYADGLRRACAALLEQQRTTLPIPSRLAEAAALCAVDDGCVDLAPWLVEEKTHHHPSALFRLATLTVNPFYNDTLAAIREIGPQQWHFPSTVVSHIHDLLARGASVEDIAWLARHQEAEFEASSVSATRRTEPGALLALGNSTQGPFGNEVSKRFGRETIAAEPLLEDTLKKARDYWTDCIAILRSAGLWPLPEGETYDQIVAAAPGLVEELLARVAVERENLELAEQIYENAITSGGRHEALLARAALIGKDILPEIISAARSVCPVHVRGDTDGKLYDLLPLLAENADVDAIDVLIDCCWVRPTFGTFSYLSQVVSRSGAHADLVVQQLRRSEASSGLERETVLLLDQYERTSGKPVSDAVIWKLFSWAGSCHHESGALKHTPCYAEELIRWARPLSKPAQYIERSVLEDYWTASRVGSCEWCRENTLRDLMDWCKRNPCQTTIRFLEQHADEEPCFLVTLAEVAPRRLRKRHLQLLKRVDNSAAMFALFMIMGVEKAVKLAAEHGADVAEVKRQAKIFNGAEHIQANRRWPSLPMDPGHGGEMAMTLHLNELADDKVALSMMGDANFDENQLYPLNTWILGAPVGLDAYLFENNDRRRRRLSTALRWSRWTVDQIAPALPMSDLALSRRTLSLFALKDSQSREEMFSASSFESSYLRRTELERRLLRSMHTYPEEVYQAIAGQDVDDVRRLLAGCGYVNGRDAEMNTLLHHCALSDADRIADMLIEFGCDIDAQNCKSESALHLAADSNAIKMVHLLKTCGANPNLLETRFLTPLGLAVMKGHTRVVRILLEQGASLTGVSVLSPGFLDPPIHLKGPPHGTTPLHLAAEFNDELTIAALLIDYGANVNARDNRGSTPLDVAGSRQFMVDLLVEHGATRSNTLGNTGEQPLSALPSVL